MGAKIQLLVLDVLKPHEPDVVRYAHELADLNGVEMVNIEVEEFDARTESLKVTLKGEGMDLETIGDRIRSLGGSIHSVDRVLAGKKPLTDTKVIGGEA